MIVIDADIEPDFRHPLGMAHRTGPRSPHLLRRAPAAVDDPQRIDQFGLPIGLAARRIPGKCRERRKHRAHVVALYPGIAEGGFDAPQRQQRAALDAVIPFDPREQRLVFPQRFLAGGDAPVGDAAIDVLPGLLAELRLVPHLIEYGDVRLDAAHDAVPGRLGNAFCQRVRAEAVPPLVEAGRSRCERAQRRREQDSGRKAGSQQGAARQRVLGIIPSHRNSLAAPARARQCPSLRQLAIPLQFRGDPGQPAPHRGLSDGCAGRKSSYNSSVRLR